MLVCITCLLFCSRYNVRPGWLILTADYGPAKTNQKVYCDDFVWLVAFLKIVAAENDE